MNALSLPSASVSENVPPLLFIPSWGSDLFCTQILQNVENIFPNAAVTEACTLDNDLV